jgi:phosphoribosylformimino-5-aminoimidazole carboxamide ribotide isomerase
MLIIPAIDIYNKKTVRLVKGDFNNITYYPLTPLEQAKQYAKLGFKRIHIVDLMGSASGEVTVLDILKSIKDETSLEIEFGGGIRNLATVQSLFSIGIDKIVIGSLAVTEKPKFEFMLHSYNPLSFIISADVNDGMIAIQGWTETTSVSLKDHITWCMSLGLDQFLCTDISKDGTLLGANITLYSQIMRDFPTIKLIASGGVKDIQDLRILNEMEIYGAVIGKAIYEKTINPEELISLAK